MSRVGRYAKATAKPGQGDALAALLLEVAEGMHKTPGCELYVINRVPGEPDVVWVTELWSSQEQLDASLETPEAKAGIPEVRALIDGFERIDLDPQGGIGLDPPPASGYTLVNIADVEDLAAKYGYGEMGESRFAADALEAERTGVAHFYLRPSTRQMFGHHHHRAEEVYLVLEGSGRVRIEDEIVDLRALDAIRVAPDQTRQFEAGPEGMRFVAVSARARDDAEIVQDFWTD